MTAPVERPAGRLPPTADSAPSARPPLSPVPLMVWLWRLLLEVVNEYREDRVGDLAAAITFWTLLSIPASILAVVSALSSTESVIGTSAAEDFEREIQTFISDTFANSQTLSDAVAQLFQGSNGGVVTGATLVAIYTLSRGFAGLIRGLDTAYEVEESRPWWHVRLVAIGLGITTVIVAVGASVVLALLPELPAGAITRLLVGPGAFILIVLWAATLFHIGPNHHTPWRYDVPGALLTAVGWVAATQGFALYVRYAGSGNQVQTTVGAVLLALTLLHLLSMVMLMGAELNDVLGRRAGVVQEPKRLRDRYGRAIHQFSRPNSHPATADRERPDDD